ncbi:MAG TPA: LuxR C-terminal-related transcriptional regulator [Patescibacteria group bacterium]|nr:LuxR C-terminal-related transcriptional regulator [Patescibacteria group bacterium]
MIEIELEQVKRARNASSERVPFEMLSPREQEVLQYVADGLRIADMAELMHTNVKTVEATRYNIGNIGLLERETHTPDRKGAGKSVLLALIQDGINYDYVSHNIDESEEIQPLFPSEALVLEQVAQGKSHEQIAQIFGKSIKTVEIQMGNALKSLNALNFYHAVARMTYLKKVGLWTVRMGSENNQRLARARREKRELASV